MWLDKRNHDREMQLMGHGLGNADNTQNTVFCLFEPGAAGLAADDFPTEDSVFFGSRPGRRRPFLPGMANISEEQARKAIHEFRKAEVGHDPDPEVVARIAWEYQNVIDGYGLAKVMNELTGRFETKPGHEADLPVLPEFPDLGQTINMAACDSRGVLALVVPEGGHQQLEDQLARLAFTEGIAGRTHICRMTTEEWASARKNRLVLGGTDGVGLRLVSPDPYGLEGEVFAEFEFVEDFEQAKSDLKEQLDAFRNVWRKSDRTTHLRMGSKNGITWSEYDADVDDIVRITPTSGAKKLGPTRIVH